MEFRKNRMEPWTLTIGDRQCRRFWKRRFAMLGQPVASSRLGTMLPGLLLLIMAMPILELTTVAVTADESTQLGVTTPSVKPAIGKGLVKRYVEVPGSTSQNESSRDRLTLVAGRKQIHASKDTLHFSSKAKENFDVTQLTESTQEILAHASGVFQAKSGDRDLKVVVVVDPAKLESRLAEDGYHSITVTPAVQGVVLSGVVDKPHDRKRCIRLAEEHFAAVIDQLNVRHAETQVLVACEMLELVASETTTNAFIQKHLGERSQETEIGGISGILTNNNEFTKFREEISNVGKVTVKSRPQLITISGRAANIFMGRERPIMVPNGNKVEIHYQKIGTQVEFLPAVIGNDRLTLECRPKVTELADPIDVDGVDVPRIRSSFQTASVEMKSNQRLVSVMKIAKTEGDDALQRYLVTIAKPTIITPQQSTKLTNRVPLPRPIRVERR